MGYAVYEERANGRWAGYAVPAQCDTPDCPAQIDRGLAYKCEHHGPHEGCELFFCSEHRYDTAAHDEVDPKPDSAEWCRHVLTDASWSLWRKLNPERVAAMQQIVGGVE